MAKWRLSGFSALAVSLATLATFAGDTLIAAEPSTQPSEVGQVAEVRAAMKSYFALLTAGKWEAAAASCYSTNDDEKAAARILAEWRSEYIRGQALAKKAGADVIRSYPFKVPTFDRSSIAVSANEARVSEDGNVGYVLIHVDGAWRISMAADPMRHERPAAALEKSCRATIEMFRESREELEKLARARAAAAERPDNELLLVLPSDATPSGALRRFAAYCAATRIEDAVALCQNRDKRETALASAIAFHFMTARYLHASCMFQLGEEATAKVFPSHLSYDMVDQCKFEIDGERALATLPAGEVLPLLKVNGHWKLATLELCRMKGMSAEEMFAAAKRSGEAFHVLGDEIRKGKLASSDAVIAVMKERGVWFEGQLPSKLPQPVAVRRASAPVQE